MSTDTLSLGPSYWTPSDISNDDMYQGLTGAYQTAARTGNRLGLVLVYQNLYSTRRRTMEAHARQLKVRINRLKVNMSTLGYSRSGAGGGTPLLVGSHLAGATSLSFDGGSGSVTNYLTGQDYITIGNQLVRVTAACNTTSGAGTLSIWPELHQNYADNTALNISTPFGVYLLKDPVQYGEIVPYLSGDYMLSSLIFSLEQDVLA